MPDQGLIKKVKKAFFLILVLLVDIVLIIHIIQSVGQFSLLSQNIECRKIQDGVMNATAADKERDGDQEIYYVSSGQPEKGKQAFSATSPLSSSGSHPKNYSYEYLFRAGTPVFPPQDISGDGMIDAFALEKRPEGIALITPWARDFDWVQRIFQQPWIPFKEGNAGLSAPQFLDLAKNGGWNMVSIVHSGWPLLPRGLIVHDARTGKKIWEFRCGCQIWKYLIRDLDGDGKNEILASGWSPNNGVSDNGTDDAHSYLFVLEDNGSLKWKDAIGGPYTRLFFDVGDVDLDGRLEIVVSKDCHKDSNGENGEIRIYGADKPNAKLKKTEPGVQFSNIHILESKESARPLIVFGDSRGRISAVSFNGNGLEIIRRREYPSSAQVVLIAPLGTEPAPDRLFAIISFNTLLVLDAQLNTCFETAMDFHDWGAENVFFPYTASGQRAAGFALKNLYLITNESPSLGLWFKNLLASQLPLFAALFFMWNTLAVWILKSRPFRAATVSNEENGLPGLAQEVAHKMKTPLFTIQLEAEKLTEVDTRRSIMEDVAKLKNLNRSLMKILAVRPLKLEPIDLQRLIKDLADRYMDLLKGKIEFRLDLDPDDGVLDADKVQLEEAFANIIENAIEALPESGVISLTTTIVHPSRSQREKEIEIEIVDNGIGIPADRLEEIFKPYVSTKKDGVGIGLAIAKRIIEAHSGRILVESKLNAGTRFTVLIPLRQKTIHEKEVSGRVR